MSRDHGVAETVIEIEVAARRRRELIARLCMALNDALTPRDQWESGCELRHWQVTVDDFAALPADIIGAVFDEWSEADQRLDEIEFSGYMDTADGHRAWGFLALRPDQSRVQGRPEVQELHLTEHDDGYLLKATIRRTPTGTHVAEHG